MRPVHFLSPALTLVICGIWLGDHRRTIDSLKNQSSMLRNEIAARKADHLSGDTASRRSASSGAALKGEEPLDWKKIAALLTDTQKNGGMGDVHNTMRLQQQLMAMEKEELADAFGQIALLDLPEQGRQALEGMLIGALMEKDPEFALVRCIGLMDGQHSTGHSSQFFHGFGKWAKKDPAAAMAWFDQQIAAGVFDSKSLESKSLRLVQFEGALIGALLASRPEDASRRLAVLPEDQRVEVLRNYVANSLGPETQAAYANLVRQSLQEEQSLELISQIPSRSAYDNRGYAAATECMDRIGATPVERGACVEKFAQARFGYLSGRRKISREDLDELRFWAGAQAPDVLNRATGMALAGSLNGTKTMNFPEVAALALDYHSSGGGDELLMPLLEHWRARENKEQASELAGRISDEALREEFLNRLE